MVLDFLKYIYRYFSQDQAGSGVSPKSEVNSESKHVSLHSLVPIHDASGKILSYMQVEHSNIVGGQGGSVRNTESSQSIVPQVKPQTTVAVPQANENSTILYVHTPEGHFIPIKDTPQHTNRPPPTPLPSKNQLEADDGAWDGWTDGNFRRDFTFEEFEQTNSLKVHWACKVNGGDRKGDSHANSWEMGKPSWRQCLGIIVCDNDNCEIVIRPHISPQRLAKQLSGACACGAQPVHQRCGICSTLWTWSGGVHYENGGRHTHPRPTHILHLLPNEERRFEALIKANPNIGPLGLIVGVPGLEGPGESAADISDIFLNANRVSKERQKIKRGLETGGDTFIESFAKFSRQHPGFVIFSQIGIITVISVQSAFMLTQLVKDHVLDGPINGMVNDAAHGWWRERNSLLMVTSTYSPDLFCWVPGILSYTNGASADHFMYHFLGVFQSMAMESEKRNILVVDHLFAGVMDFSEAERIGFIRAFVEFWMMRSDNTRSHQQLEQAAENLLRGCEEHFRAGVTRVSRISGVIPSGMADAFTKRALALLDTEDPHEFQSHAALVVRDFPKVKSWMEWWLQPHQ